MQDGPDARPRPRSARQPRLVARPGQTVAPVWAPGRAVSGAARALRHAALLPLLVVVALLAIPVRCDASPHTHSLFAAPLALEEAADLGSQADHHAHGLGHPLDEGRTNAADPGSLETSEFANWAPAPAVASPVEAIGGDAGVPVEGAVGDDAAPRATTISPETPPPNVLSVG